MIHELSADAKFWVHVGFFIGLFLIGSAAVIVDYHAYVERAYRKRTDDAFEQMINDFPTGEREARSKPKPLSRSSFPKWYTDLNWDTPIDKRRRHYRRKMR